MLERFINTLYPLIEERSPLPVLYIPGAFMVLVFGYAIGPDPIRTTTISLLLVLFALRRPCYTVGNTAQDYGLSGWFIVFVLLFLDFSATNPRWVGRRDESSSRKDNESITRRDPETWPQRLAWALRLATTLRGIGWDWEVKSVPRHLEADFSRLKFVGKRMLDLALHTLVKLISLYIIGFCGAIQQDAPSSSPWMGWLLRVVENWCGAIWSWNTVGVGYVAISAIAVLLGMSEPWEWPPILNSVATATSVRRTWSVAYHQILRRTVQQPGIRLARLLGFKKGSIPSRYIQLYLAFYISFCIHWWQQYVITRGDKGEFAFFMMQPLVITLEDSVQWVWRNAINPKRKQDLLWFEIAVGYAWTFTAFAFTLTPFVKGMVATGIIGGSPEDAIAMLLGQRHGAKYLQYWH
ncbi:hypothetical protein F5Y00DRAFT_271315 [Daldinia vernicosa]|uniref:uncharacterized protein n=1 Tax=Daldinia vernicosa TaxID=114800 RepID=UPI002007F8D4|nr:uncharacterized protein F5Y00DRAFT_271315 [Daldinia vernicosa]KAI0847196.1 hypothetical protein F5Y00DRAFT_271315 [Daldinia vernicosa]